MTGFCSSNASEADVQVMPPLPGQCRALGYAKTRNQVVPPAPFDDPQVVSISGGLRRVRKCKVSRRPFPNVADHVVEAVTVRLEATDGRGAAVAVLFGVQDREKTLCAPTNLEATDEISSAARSRRDPPYRR